MPKFLFCCGSLRNKKQARKNLATGKKMYDAAAEPEEPLPKSEFYIGIIQQLLT